METPKLKYIPENLLTALAARWQAAKDVDEKFAATNALAKARVKLIEDLRPLRRPSERSAALSALEDVQARLEDVEKELQDLREVEALRRNQVRVLLSEVVHDLTRRTRHEHGPFFWELCDKLIYTRYEVSARPGLLLLDEKLKAASGILGRVLNAVGA